MLKLEVSPPCESLGPGSISKINNTEMGAAGGDQFTSLEKSRLSKEISKIFCSGLSENLKIFGKADIAQIRAII